MYELLIGRRAPVSSKVLRGLELLGGGPATAREIAKACDYPLTCVRSALYRLVKWRVIHSPGTKIEEIPSWFYRTLRRKVKIYQALQMCLFDEREKK